MTTVNFFTTIGKSRLPHMSYYFNNAKPGEIHDLRAINDKATVRYLKNYEYSLCKRSCDVGHKCGVTITRAE